MVAEKCTCGGTLTVMAVMDDGTPVTRCNHCDTPLICSPSTPALAASATATTTTR